MSFHGSDLNKFEKISEFKINVQKEIGTNS